MDQSKLTQFIASDVTERFLRYVQVDTQARPGHAALEPSSPGQMVLLKTLHDELIALGVKAVELTKEGYVYGTIAASEQSTAEPITLLAHVDTAPDCSGKAVKPRVIKNYQGEVISYPDDASVSLSPKISPQLSSCIGDDIIVASGLTLLGSDDKAGVAEIMTLAATFLANPDLPHPEIRICFTCDEEIGQGINGIDFSKLSKRCITLDAGEPGELEYECFDAWGFALEFLGVSTHPGTAYQRMINAATVAAEFVAGLPAQEKPETTKEREGFYHIVELQGNIEKATVRGILRDFDSVKNQARISLIKQQCLALEAKYVGLKVNLYFKQQYQNMYEVLKHENKLLDLCRAAIADAGLESIETPIRGGTDGALLSFKGFPCPNLCSGQAQIHARTEWTSVKRLAKCVEVLLNLCRHTAHE
jgi:tripeptide aminopeptidase